jgi:serine/threonine protein kinase
MNKHHIPKCIWCFWDSKDLPDTVKKSIDTWKHFNPDYKITVINKRNIKKLIPNINFNKIKIAKDSIQKYSDFIRINVLKKYGGIWIDGSSFSTCSFDEWFHKIGIKKTTDFIGYVNPQFNKVKYEKKYPMIENWFFACPKNSKFVKEWHKEFMKLKNLDDVNDYIDEVVEEGIDMQWIDNPQYLTQHLAAQVILQRGYNMKNMILLNAIQNKYGNGPLHYFISDKAWTLTDVESVRTLCKDKKEWSQPIVKLVGDTRRIVENNKSIKKCVFKIIEDLLKDKKDLGNKRSNKTKRTKRTNRNKKRTIKRRKRTIRKKGGMRGSYGVGTGIRVVPSAMTRFPERPFLADHIDKRLFPEDYEKMLYNHFNSNITGPSLPIFHLDTPQTKYNGYWKVLETGSTNQDEGDLLKISFQIEGEGLIPWFRDVSESAKLGGGSFGKAYNGSITELKRLREGEENPEVWSSLQVGGEYAIKLMKSRGKALNERQQWYDENRKEFKSMKDTYNAAPNLFLRPHLLLQKDKDSLAIVMELGGKSLHYYLGEGKEPFMIQDLKRHVGDLAVAIATIHSMGYIHRDLKPENILLVDYGGQLQLKVIDLGLMVKTDHGDKNPVLCCAPSGSGSYIWMSPEYLINGRSKIGRASDWWAFGLIILQLLGYFGKGIDAQYCRVTRYRKGLFVGLRDIMLPSLKSDHSKIFEGSEQERLTEIASGCHFYNESREDIEELVEFAFYFLDPVSRTRPFLRLDSDTKTGNFETREGETAEKLQQLVDNLFPKYGIKTK